MSGDDKTIYYILIAISLSSCLSVASSLGASFTGVGFVQGIQARIIALFGGPSIEEQAQLKCPSSNIDKTKAIDYINGTKTCPPVSAPIFTGSVRSGATPGTPGSTSSPAS
jgi:hypothetical protein